MFDTWSGIASGNGTSQPPSQRASADGASNLADDVSDTASDISGAYTASSTGVGSSRQHPHSASNWCRDHWVNNKVLGIADATRYCIHLYTCLNFLVFCDGMYWVADKRTARVMADTCHDRMSRAYTTVIRLRHLLCLTCCTVNFQYSHSQLLISLHQIHVFAISNI